MPRWIAVILVLITASLAGAQSPTTQPLPFRVYDSLLFKNRPDTTGVGMVKIYVTDREMFAPTDKARTLPDEQLTRALARKVDDLGQILCLDIENWELNRAKVSQEQFDENLRKMNQVVDWIRDERPNLKLGHYSFMPIRDYWLPQKMAAQPKDDGVQAAAKSWRETNLLLKPLADKLDYTFPCLYTFYGDQKGWETYAKYNIEEARQYGKPVIPFIWPEYHYGGDAKLKGQLIPGEQWAAQLAYLQKHADGVVIWGGWGRDWDEQSPWWGETKKFLKKLPRRSR